MASQTDVLAGLGIRSKKTRLQDTADGLEEAWFDALRMEVVKVNKHYVRVETSLAEVTRDAKGGGRWAKAAWLGADVSRLREWLVLILSCLFFVFLSCPPPMQPNVASSKNWTQMLRVSCAVRSWPPWRRWLKTPPSFASLPA